MKDFYFINISFRFKIDSSDIHHIEQKKWYYIIIINYGKMSVIFNKHLAFELSIKTE